MVTQSKTQLKEHVITEDLLACDSNEPNLKNFCGKKVNSHKEPSLDTMIKIQSISMLQQRCKTI